MDVSQPQKKKSFLYDKEVLALAWDMMVVSHKDNPVENDKKVSAWIQCC